MLDEGTRGVGDGTVRVEEGWDVGGGMSVFVVVCDSYTSSLSVIII